MMNNQYFDRIGIVLCQQGYRQLQINGKSYIQKKGMILILSPLFVIHEVEVSSDYKEQLISSEPHVVFSLLNRISRIVVAVHIINHPCFETDEPLYSCIEANALRISSYERMRDSSENTDEKGIYDILIEKIVEESVLRVALFLYLKSRATDTHETANENVLFEFVLQLQQSVMSNRSVEYYAQLSNLSVGYFSSVIRKTAGVSPSRIIAAFTIARAKILLGQSKKTIKEIASEMNFPEQYTFRKYFKQHTGLAPTAYRISTLKCPQQ